MVVGGETMRKVTGWEATDCVATLGHPEAEYNMGLTFPALGGMFARLYMERYGVTEQDGNSGWSRITRTAPRMSMRYRDGNGILEDSFMDSPNADVVNNYVAEPLRLFGICRFPTVAQC